MVLRGTLGLHVSWCLYAMLLSNLEANSLALGEDRGRQGMGIRCPARLLPSASAGPAGHLAPPNLTGVKGIQHRPFSQKQGANRRCFLILILNTH